MKYTRFSGRPSLAAFEVEAGTAQLARPEGLSKFLKLIHLALIFLPSVVSCGGKSTSPYDLRAARSASTQDQTDLLKPSRFELVGLPATRLPNPSPVDRVELTLDEISRETSLSDSSKEFLPLFSAETRRTQDILDRIFEALKKSSPDRFRSIDNEYQIPRPSIRILKDDHINAYVQRVSVCYPAKIILSGSDISLDDSEEPQKIVSIDRKGRVGIFNKSGVSCIDRRHQEVRVQDVLNAISEDILPGSCTLDRVDDTIKLGPNCQYERSKAPNSAQSLLLTTTTNLIVVSTGALNIFKSDDELAYTLAHELAHYLYAHGSISKAGYNFFYIQNLKNLEEGKPKPNTEFDGLGEKLIRLPGYRTQPIPDQKLHSELFPYFRMAMNQLIEPLCSPKNATCHQSCSGLRKVVVESENLKKFGLFPQGSLQDDALELYYNYERELLKCAMNFKLSRTQVKDDQEQAPESEARKIFWNVGPDSKATLHDLISDMNQRLWAKEKAKNDLLEQALSSRLGYFTTEEEADNLALEWSLRFNIKPEILISYWLKYLRSMQNKEQDSALSFGTKRCQKFFLDNFEKLNQETAPLVPIGSFADFHHSLCYRAFHTARRLAVRYKRPINPSVIQDFL